MIFASDNWAGAHPAISAYLHASASGYAQAYGSSDRDDAVRTKFCEIFERDVAVFYVSTGTAANSLAVSATARPGGVAFCHAEAHMVADECGAPEFLSGGARLCPVDGALGRIGPDALSAAIGRYPAAFLHGGQPALVSITQSTEIGTVYGLDEIAAVAETAQRHGLPLHMDGARFANALVTLGCTPAEMTWKRGVDILSFGGTKNGCWCAEALVVFNPAALTAELRFIHKRAAQLFSKARFVSAQFEAYFADDLWLDNARHANAMATRLAAAFDRSGIAKLAWQPQANEVFAILPETEAARLQEAGARFYPWATPRSFAGELADGARIYRFVTSFATTGDDVERFAALLDSSATRA